MQQPSWTSLLFVAAAAAAAVVIARPAHAQQAQASSSSSAAAATAQSSTVSSNTTTTGMSTITLPAPTTIPFSSSTTTSTSSANRSSEVPAPTANTTTSTWQQVRLWPPKGGLVMCQRVEFAFTGPAVPKSCGVYVTNTSTYLQQIPLGGGFTSLTGGTFPWLVDLPAGLSVQVQFWVSINNRVEQFTLRDLVVQPSADSSCIATGSGQNTQSIVSYASSLNSSWVWQPPTSAAAERSGDGNKAGPIAGGVVGGLVGIALVILTIYFCLRRRRARSVHPPPLFGGHNADKGSPPMTHAQMVALKYQGYPSPGTGATPTADESSNYSPVASKPSGQIPPVPYVSQKELQRAPNPTAPGSVSSSVSRPSGGNTGAASSPITAQSRRGHEGTRGLDDPGRTCRDVQHRPQPTK